jgi:putative ABC transport system permease protein
MWNVIQDVRFAARMLRRYPGFTVVAVLALALGIGANTAVFAVVNGVLLRPLPFPEADRLFLVSYLPPPGGPFQFEPSLSDRHYLEFRGHDKLFEQLAAFSARPVSLTGAGEPVRLPAARVTSDFLSALRVNPAIGRAFLNEEADPGRDHVVLLGDRLWRDRFNADRHVVGQSISLDGVSHLVVGVMPPGFAFPSKADLWTPMAIRTNPHNSFMFPVVGRLKPGVSREQAQAELVSIAGGLPRDPRDKRREMVAQILPLKELVVGDIRKSLMIFLGAVAFVLLIACANVANLLLMRAASRQQEIAVRAALGASRRRLILQLLTESLMVSLAGGAAGMLLAIWGVPILLALAPAGQIPRVQDIRIDGGVLAFTLGLSLLTGLVFGLAPAFQAARRGLHAAMGEGGRTSTARREGIRGVLVVAEVALALVLLTGAGLMLKSFLRMRAVDPGFRPENVLTMTVDLPDSVYRNASDLKAFHQSTLEKLSRVPGVLRAGAVNWLPLAGALTMGDFHRADGRPLPPEYMVDKPGVSPGYFQTMGIRSLSGRDFSERDTATAPGVAIVSSSVARDLWPGENPVGQRITLEDNPKPQDWLTIVGVVEDVRQQSLKKKPAVTIYQPLPQVTRPFFLSHMTFAVRTASDPVRVASAMRSVLHEVDRDQPVQKIATMEELVAATTAEPLFQARLLGGFSIIALLLSAIGIYGVLAYSVTERTHEIGIRMALGAGRRDVLRMVLSRTMMLAAAGVALGTVGALAVTRVLAKVLFEVKPTDPATFIAVAVTLAAVALLAGFIPARRASGVEPLVALRYE